SFVNFTSGTEDGFGSVNLQLNMFNGTDHPSNQLVFTVTNTSGTWASASNVLTANSQGTIAAAHIVVFASNNVVNGQQLATGYVANGGAINVPEPGTLALALTGAAGFALAGWRRLRRQKAAA